MPATTDARETLREVEAQLAQQRDALAEALTERDTARDAFAQSGNLSTDSDEFRTAQTAVDKVGGLREGIADLQKVQVATLEMLGGEPPRSEDTAPAGDPSDPRGWDSSLVLSNEEVRQTLTHLSSTKSKFGSVQLGEVASREAMVADVTGTTNMRRGEYLGVLPQLRRRLRILDLLPTGTMDNNSIPYTQESGSFTTAAETAEGEVKPEGALTLTDAEAVAATIAHWLKIRKQALSDFPALRAIIDGRLRYGVLRRLEGQVLNGNGASPNMRGILQTSGIGAVTFTAGDKITDQILKGITTVYLAEAEATGIVMHPTDWQNALMLKSTFTASAGVTGGSGEYFSGGPFGMTAETMWGVPLIPSAALTQGTALVADFEIGATLLIREGVNVLLSDSDQDDFLRNRITLLGEMRAALPVWRPPAFCSVALQ